MTNPSLPKTSDTPKISDLVAPAERGRVRAGSGLPDRGPSPAAQRFDQVLQTVAKRSTPERAQPSRSTPDRNEFGPSDRPAPARSEVQPNKPSSRRPDRADERDRSEAPAASDRPDEPRQADDELEAVERDDTDGDATSADQSTDEESADSAGDDPDAAEANNDGAEAASSDAATGDPAGIAADLVLAAADDAADSSDAEAAEESADGPTVVALESTTSLDQEAEQADEVDLTAAPLNAGANVQAPVIVDDVPAEEVTTDEATEAVEAEAVTETSDTEDGGEAQPIEAEGGEAGDASESDADAELADQGQTADPEADADGGEGQSQPKAKANSEAPGTAPQSAIGNQTAVTTSGIAAAAATVNGPVAEVGTATTAATTAAGGATAAGQAVDGEDGDLLWRQVRRAIGSIRTNTIGEQQMTIRLRPAELGSVMVRISTGEAGTTVALVTESAAAASQLNQQRQQLISELEEGGLADVAVDVGTNDDTQQNQTEESEGDVEGGDGTRRSTIGGIGQDGEPIDRFRTQRVSGSQTRLVDVDL